MRVFMNKGQSKLLLSWYWSILWLSIFRVYYLATTALQHLKSRNDDEKLKLDPWNLRKTRTNAPSNSWGGLIFYYPSFICKLSWEVGMPNVEYYIDAWVILALDIQWVVVSLVVPLDIKTTATVKDLKKAVTSSNIILLWGSLHLSLNEDKHLLVVYVEL